MLSLQLKCDDAAAKDIAIQKLELIINSKSVQKNQLV
jgi:hypothetical protein